MTTRYRDPDTWAAAIRYAAHLVSNETPKLQGATPAEAVEMFRLNLVSRLLDAAARVDLEAKR